MKHLTRSLCLLILLLMTITNFAQEPAPNAFVLRMGDDGIPQVGEVTLPGPSLFVDWNPQDSGSWARVDDFGILRFAPIGSSEGVYSFSPYFQGFSTASREENRLFVDEVQWSPNGQQLAFRINSGSEMGNDGVWFWQPAIETATDPSYHLLRDCPPGCGLVNARDTEKWESLSVEWAPDNVAMLVHLYLEEEERNAIGLIFASRDSESPQADIQPPTYRYEYGSWANDAQWLVVSGYDADENAVFGLLNRDGTSPLINEASDIGLAYTRNAVQHPDSGQLLMLGSSESNTAPVAIYDENGTALTGIIGNQSPDNVAWSPDKNAVLLQIGEQSYIATINGAIYNITDLVAGNPMVNWVSAGFPQGTTALTLPQATEIQPTATPIVITISGTDATSGTSSGGTSQTLFVPETDFNPGQLLEVAVENVSIYTEPIVSAEVVADLEQGEALVLIGGPLTDGVTVWWRVQTLDFIGWAEETVNGITQFSS